MAKINVNPKKLNELISQLYTVPSSGATLSHPNFYPELFLKCMIKPRNSWSNVLLGTTITNPSKQRYIIGISYFDLSENKDNEDLFELNTKNFVIETGYKGKFDRTDPLYRDTHKNPKKYLRTPMKEVEILFKKIRYNLIKNN